ncbi:conserved hypothetical protein [Anaeromyxobacter dehalogenans 2CP-1]|uniref:DUF4253 domain-containing protein n=1 Tax=Anaeromyxobacter dehalogenans (strain ATCC BAA-258 / DSM 21875 / 2CP-1) TaxID=455488 RepID=B8J8I9_ANAD2|nr:DUF4253 domain-containing protein [Anaeromyxobacter dehalogenans]ACL67275.1 conserved hypothetical protein [Anaeromyxobacter dehalogenans 2CP-1]
MSFWKRWLGRGASEVEPAGEAPAAETPEFPYPLVAVPGRIALEEWQRLREAWRPEGACPVLLGTREQVESAREGLEGGDAATMLKAAEVLDAREALDRRLRELEQDYAEDPPDDNETGLFVPQGAWPAAPSRGHQLGAHCDITTDLPHPVVYLARIPTVRSWEAFAYLNYGAWNACPATEEHVALHRHWHERHGSEVYAIAGDVVECWVPRPPEDREGAEALAREQCLYCDDIVHQGTQTLLNLAAELKDAHAWFFWWD